MGGKAFEGTTRRILKEEVKPTLDWLIANWSDSKIQGGNFMDHLLGSVGKNETSGDIDLNLRIELYDQGKVASDLVAILGEDNVKARPGNNQIFTAVPIMGDAENGFVQVDFMFGNYEWQKFSYYSPQVKDDNHFWRIVPGASQFKGLYRTELLKAVVAFNSDWVVEDGEEMIARVGPTFFHDKGCVWRYRYRPMRKDGTARVKEFKEVSKDEFLEVFPSAITASKDIIIDPIELKAFLFRDNYYTKRLDLDSLESVWNLCQRTYEAQEQKRLIKIYLERLNNLKAAIPAEFKHLGIKV